VLDRPNKQLQRVFTRRRPLAAYRQQM